MVGPIVFALAGHLVVSPTIGQSRESAEPITTTTLPWKFLGPFVHAQDGILGVTDGRVLLNKNDGKGWRASQLLPGSTLKPINDVAMVKTKSGRIVVAFIDNSDRKFLWDDRRKTVSNDTRSDLYTVYSEDDGKTFTGLTKIQTTYAGAARSMVETPDGSLVLASISITPQNPTHVTFIHQSTNGGKSWSRSATLDIGGRGDHDGIIEGALLPLKDGRVIGMFRTNTDFLFQSFSADNGKTWSKPASSGIQSSSSPAALYRLASGNILIVYSPLYPSGQNNVRRVGGRASERSASWFRRELWARISNDEAKTWSRPKQLLGNLKSDVSYPQIFEPEPGKIWVTTYQGKITLEFSESSLTTGQNRQDLLLAKGQRSLKTKR